MSARLGAHPGARVALGVCLLVAGIALGVLYAAADNVAKEQAFSARPV